MKTLTLWQPWASFIADGLKLYETRSWDTRYRGPLAIHAAARWQPDQARIYLQLRQQFPQLHIYPPYNTRDVFILGQVIAIVELSTIQRVEWIRDDISPLERALGDYSDGRFAWKVRLVEKLAAPVSVAGKQGLWEWEP